MAILGLPICFIVNYSWITGGYIGEAAIIFQIAYGSIILSFLAGISGVGVMISLNKRKIFQLVLFTVLFFAQC